MPGTLSAPATVCATANSGNLSITGYTGSIIRWESSADNGTTWNNIANTTNTLSYNNLASTTLFRVLIQSGVCAAIYSNTVTITVLQPVSIANAGPDQILCNVAAATLAATTPSLGTGSWSAVAGNPSSVTFTNASSPSSTVSGLIAGVYQFVWSVSNGSCANSKDTVQVTVYPPTTPGTLNADATVCASANSGTLSLTGYVSSIVQWESSTNNGISWNTIANTTNTLNYINVITTTKYRVSVKNAVCPSLYSNEVTVNVLQPVTIAYAGPDTTVINGITSYKLSGNTPSSGTGVWSVIPGGPSALTIVNPADPNTTVSGLTYNPGSPPTDGIYRLVWTISNGYCAISRDTMQITVQPPTNPGVIGPDAVVCTGNNSGLVTLTGYVGTILQWELSTNYGTSWSVITRTVNTNQDTLHYENLTTTTLFRALVKNGVGLSLYSGIAATITVLQLVTPANAGSDQVLCNTSVATMNGNTPSSGTGVWSALAGNPSSVTFSNASDPKTIISGLVNGSYQFVWSISNGICSDSKDTVIVTVQLPTIAGTIAADASVCATSNNGTLLITGYRGSILDTEVSTDNGASWTAITGTANQSSYTYNNLINTSQFRARVQNSVCPALVTNIITITVLQAVTIANAGIDQQLCNVSSVTLAANTPSSGTGKWTALPSNPTSVSFTNNADPNTTVNGLTTGTYQFIWTISNALCADSKDTVQITVYPPTQAGTLTADATVCATSNSGTLSLSGYVSTIVRWESSLNGTTWNNIANTSATLNYNNLTTSIKYRAFVQNAVCPALYSNTVSINVMQAVTIANAGIDQQLCNVSSVTLAANTPSSGTGKWTALPSNPTSVSFTNNADPNTTVNGLTTGTYQFIWTISNALCADSKDTVQITVYPPTIPGSLSADAFVCVSGNSGTVSLRGYTGTIIQWEYSTDNGVKWNTISNTTATYRFTNLSTTTQYRVLVQSGLCRSVYSNIVTIHVDPVSVGGRLMPLQQNVCSGSNTGSLQVVGFTGTIMHWESSVDNGNTWTIINLTDSSYTYSSLTATTWFRVLIESGVCSSAYSTIGIVTVNKPTVAGTIAGDAIVCNGMNTGSIVLSGRTGNILHWESSEDNGSTWKLISIPTDTLFYSGLTRSTLYRALVKNGACAMQYSNTVVITVVDPVTIANAGVDQIICDANSTVTLGANKPVSGSGTWKFISGPSAVYFTNASLPNTTVTGLKTGTYQFAWTISNGICNHSTDTVMIKVDKVISAFNLSSINDCGKTTYRFYNTSESVFGIKNSKWFSSKGDTMNSKDISLSFTTDASKDISLRVESNTGCVQTTQALYNVIVYQFPKVNINAIADACKNQMLQIVSKVNSQDSIAYLLWNLGNGSKKTDSIIDVQFIENGNYTIKLTVATVNHCFDSAYKEIMVHALPVITINSKPIVCKGDSIELAASGAMNYIWSDNNNSILCSGCSSTKVRPLTNQQFRVIGYNEYGCSEAKTAQIRVVQPLKVLSAKGDTLCSGQSRQLFVSGASVYNWYPETGLNNKNIASPIAKPLSTTTYHVIGKDDFNCFADTAEVQVVVGKSTPINIGKDTVLSAGTVYQLNASISGQANDIRKWYWNSPDALSCKTCPSPTVRVTNDAVISCLAINIYGCTSTDTINIKTFCPSTEIFIPNAFTPDGDGINDKLIVQGKGVKMIRYFRIFNRWGEVVFEKNNFLPGDPGYAWDGTVRGKPASPDVFVYMCEVICEKGLPTVFKGNVAILK